MNMNYTDARIAMARKQDFEHNGTMRAFNIRNHYIIYSYQTMMAVVTDNKVYINKNKYSVTTSKQQNYIRSSYTCSMYRFWHKDSYQIVEVTPEELYHIEATL